MRSHQPIPVSFCETPAGQIREALRSLPDPLREPTARKPGDRMDCTPKLRHAGRQLIGDTSACFGFVLSISSRRAAGVWESRRDFQGLWERW
jgi:hypothetical protein